MQKYITIVISLFSYLEIFDNNLHFNKFPLAPFHTICLIEPAFCNSIAFYSFMLVTKLHFITIQMLYMMNTATIMGT